MDTLREVKPTYKLFVLDSEDFDNLHKDLPYMTKEKLSDSLGFANPKTNEAYVRKTAIAELDDATVEHEMMELLSKTSPDEIDGIRYKKGKDIFSSIIPMVVGGIVTALTGGGAAPLFGSTMASILGGAASAGTSAITQKNMSSSGQINPLGVALSGLGSGFMGKGLISGINASKAAGGGLLGQTLSGMQGAVGITPGAMKAGAATYGAGAPAGTINTGSASMFPAGYTANPSAFALSTAPQSVGLGQSVLGSAIGSGIGSTLAQTPKATGAGATTQVAGTGIIPATASNTTSGLNKLLTPTNILGGASLLGSMSTPSPKFEVPSSVNDLRSKLMSGQSLSPLGEQAKSELSTILKSSPTEIASTTSDAYYQQMIRRTDESYAEAQKQLDAAYNNAGMLNSGEHQAEKAKLAENLARTKSGIAADIEQQRYNLAVTQKYQAIQQALGVDSATMDDIVGLTGLDVQTAAMAYGASVEDIKTIREALGTLGVELVLRGTTGQGKTPNIINSANSGVSGILESILGK